jgi:hypothetical protein
MAILPTPNPRPRLPYHRRCLIFLALLAISGCARSMRVESPAETFSISVQNLTGIAMVVSYNDGRGDAILGTVSADATERFIIAAPAVQTVTVRGVAASGSRSAGPYSVTLVAGTPQTVRLR